MTPVREPSRSRDRVPGLAAATPPQLAGWCGAGKGKGIWNAESIVSGRELPPRRWDGRRATATLDRLDRCRNKPFHLRDSMSNNSFSEYSATENVPPQVERISSVASSGPYGSARRSKPASTAMKSLVIKLTTTTLPAKATSRIKRKTLVRRTEARPAPLRRRALIWESPLVLRPKKTEALTR